METPDPRLGPLLLALARYAIARDLGLSASPPDLGESPLAELDAPAATFVTLTRHRQLRGCIGSLEAYRSLAADVMANARAAAFHDPRFYPLRTDEWPDLRIEVSLLHPATPLPAHSEAEALARLQPGKDGLILRCGRHSATFLPQVWEALPDRHAFLSALRQKAGLAADFWSPEMELATYRVDKWKETEGALP